MTIHDAITAGIAHLHQNPLRAGLSILGILIGIASVLSMVAIGDGTKKIIVNDINKIGGLTTSLYLFARETKKVDKRAVYLADAKVIEAECPDVLYVLPKNRRYSRWVAAPQGNQF